MIVVILALKCYVYSSRQQTLPSIFHSSLFMVQPSYIYPCKYHFTPDTLSLTSYKVNDKVKNWNDIAWQRNFVYSSSTEKFERYFLLIFLRVRLFILQEKTPRRDFLTSFSRRDYTQVTGRNHYVVSSTKACLAVKLE